MIIMTEVGKDTHTHTHTVHDGKPAIYDDVFASLTRQGEPLAIQDTNMLPVVRTMS